MVASRNREENVEPNSGVSYGSYVGLTGGEVGSKQGETLDSEQGAAQPLNGAGPARTYIYFWILWWRWGELRFLFVTKLRNFGGAQHTLRHSTGAEMRLI
jgi:hypothetical protein